MMAHSSGLAVTIKAGQPLLGQVPFQVDTTGRQVRWHLAAANPHCAALASAGATRLISQRPHAYTSPRWYTHPDVPTWNYAAVHAEGVVRTLDADATAELVATLTRQHEDPAELGEFEQSAPYRGLLAAIRAFGMEGTKLPVKDKLSQNRLAGDRTRIAAAMALSRDSAAREVADLTYRTAPGAGGCHGRRCISCQSVRTAGSAEKAGLPRGAWRCHQNRRTLGSRTGQDSGELFIDCVSPARIKFLRGDSAKSKMTWCKDSLT
jgi:transcriptional regulator